MLDTLGILLEGRASVGPERSITTDEVMLVFGSPQKPIPIDLHPCKGKIFRTPVSVYVYEWCGSGVVVFAVTFQGLRV